MTVSNPTRAASDWPPAVVAGAFQTGVNLMRDLRRRGVDTCCFDCIATQPGFKSVYGKAHLCPNPDDHPEKWVDFMVALGRRSRLRPVLISSADQFVTAMARHAEILKQYFIFPDTIATQDLLSTKSQQYDIASANGLEVPRTKLCNSWAELHEFAESATFPLLIKPVHFREWFRFPPGHPLLDEKIAVAGNMEELQNIHHLAAPVTPTLVVQEIIAGPDTAKLVYLSCYARSGERLAGCVLKELRTMPMNFGSATIVEPIDDPETDRLCDNFLRRIRYSGICEIELKRDVRTNAVKLIEVNPRYSGTGDASSYVGLEVGWLHYLDLIGEPVAPVSPTNPKLHHIVLKRDFACYRSYLKAGLCTWSDLIGSYRPPVAFFDFDPMDWRVSLDTCIECFKALAAPTYRRFFPKRKPQA